MKTLAAALLLGLASTVAVAQDAKPTAAPAAAAPAAPVADPAMSALRPVWDRLKDLNLRAAGKMPEESYSFKAAAEVKSFGQIVAHLADAQFLMAGRILGETPPAADIEKTKTTKADIVAALAQSNAYLDKAFAMGDADAAKTAKLFGRDVPRFTVFATAIGHGYEHYGNLVTYMRMKGIVPPSSEPRPAAPAPAPAEKK